MKIISRKEAKAKGLKRYFTGKPCKHGHVAERYVCGPCVDCTSVKNKERYLSKRDESIEYSRKYQKEHRIERREVNKRYHWKNREKELERKRIWREENSDIVKKYYNNNKEDFYFRSAKRRAAKLQRTLPGYDKEISEIYTEAKMRRNSGEDVHVDHVVPLQGELVSGLHVPWNLEIIPAKENHSKGNKFECCIDLLKTSND